MDRRSALRNLALVVGSAALLPRCTMKMPVRHYSHFDVTMDQESLVADMAETIIPKTTTPGARDLNLDQFVWLMLNDCSKKEDQQAFFKGMGEFNDLTKKLYNKSFSECTKEQKLAVLNTFEKKPAQKNPNPADDKYSKELHAFFGTVKGLTVFGYTESQYFMTKEIVYELVPGRYNAMYPVKNNVKA
ncbi:MAG: gluconate 2-dehydrogenase subunit 3 family protein [Sphingobacteriales bacterium]